jgi:hypothetical protein
MYSRAQQVLMIANELNRAKNWIEKKEPVHVNFCYERALELTDLTSEDKKWNRVSLRELRRFREVLAESYVCPEKDTGRNSAIYRLLVQMDPGAWNLLQG